MTILQPQNFRGDGVHVWSARFEDQDSAPSELFLSADEKARLAQMPLEKRRREFTQGRFGLRQISSIYLGIPPEKIVIRVDANGKPSLGSGASSLGISLSHSDDRVVYAISHGPAVGIDIERRRLVDVNRLASGVFCARELAELKAMTNDEQRLPFFFDCWTRKEAVSKFLGLGLRAPFQEIDASTVKVDYRGRTIFTRSFDWDDFRVAVAYGSEAEIEWKGLFLP